MRVNQSTSTSQAITTDLPVELKEGEVYSVKIKEKVSEKEAIVHIRGKDVHIQFEGKVPSAERATVQITENRGQLPQVRTVSVDQGSGTGEHDVSTILRSMGTNPTPELKQATKILIDKGIPLSKEAIRDVKEFLEKGLGNLQQKLVTIHAIANKKLDVSTTQLRSIHEALHGPTLSSVLSSMEKIIDPSHSKGLDASLQTNTRSMSTIVRVEPNLEKAIKQIREQLSNNSKIDPEIAAKIEKALNEAQKLQQMGQERVGREHLYQSLTKIEEALNTTTLPKESMGQARDTASKASLTQSAIGKTQEALNQAKETVKREPSLEKAIQQIREQLSNNSKMEPEIAARIEKALNEAQKLQQMGHERAGREHLSRSLTKIEEALNTTQPKESTGQARDTASTASQTQSEIGKTQEALNQAKETVKREPSLEKAIQQIREQLSNNSKIEPEIAAKIEKALNEAQKLQQMGHERAGREHLSQSLTKIEEALDTAQPKESAGQVRDTASKASLTQSAIGKTQEALNQAKEIVKREPSLEKAIQQIREQLSNNSKIEPEIVAKIEKALNEAQKLQQMGHERAGREHLSQSLTKIEEALDTTQPKESTGQARDTASTASHAQSEIGKTQEALSQAKETVRREPSLEKAIQQIREQLGNNPKIMPEIAGKIEKALLDAQQLQQAGQDRAARVLLMQALDQATGELNGIPSQGQPTTVVGSQQPNLHSPIVNVTNPASMEPSLLQNVEELLQSLINMVQEEPSLERVLQQFQELIANHPNANSAAVSRVEKSLAQAVSLQQMGWEQVGREQVVKTIDQVGPDLVADLTVDETIDHIRNGQQQYDANIDLQMGALLATKDLVVTEITAKLSQAASHFQSVKREVTRNLDNIIQVAQSNKGNITSAVKPLLESTIDLLDKAILKSEITMLTDMETEKQIMKASSQLAEARRLLTKGENTQAMAIMNDVKSKLDSLQWKPSNVRIQHFMTSESIFSDEVPSVHKLSDQVAQIAHQHQSHEPSARNTFEFFRSLGLNYESEVAQSLSSVQQNGNDDLHKNLKAALLQLAQTEGAQSSLSNQNQQVEKALNNLTGQQLLSKSESGSNLQNMFFQLPVMLGGSLESAKLYVNSKNEGQKVDWENCSLYFLIETKKMGQTGIYISAVDRNLSITVKNNQPNIKEKVDPVISKCKDKLKEIGYNISGVTFTKLTEEAKTSQQRQQAQPSAQTTRPNTIAKGLDFKI
ncbi:hypothetical protein [Brevibacillus choshinensis]|uniref:Metal-dependent peptidase n=1 Tax=Brevibacillus choshinensis TaxID=54911 RepID=A0ABX7FNR6_BRECH|nr:hypothetical protein [Brevibacillus choshinensis]QRG67314.1 hypothetical protein JNE38_28370 [Brevibacillus choshinensis]